MRLIFTPHTLLRLKQRRIGISDVKNIVQTDGKTKVGLPVKVREASIGITKKGRKLKVVYEVPSNGDINSKIVIITAIWK